MKAIHFLNFVCLEHALKLQQFGLQMKNTNIKNYERSNKKKKEKTFKVVVYLGGIHATLENWRSSGNKKLSRGTECRDSNAIQSLNQPSCRRAAHVHDRIQIQVGRPKDPWADFFRN